MKLLATVLMSAFVAVAAGNAAATADKKDAMAKPLTMKECQDYTAMAKKDATKKDAKKDAACADMMKKDDMMKKEPMKEAPKK